MSDVTRILSQIEQGDPHAAEKLLPLVYDELRKLAAAKLAQEKPGQTLQATALVHEAYLRLVVPRREHGPAREGEAPADLAHSTAAAISSPPPPKPCGGFWSSGPASRQCEKRGGGLVRKDLDTLDLAAPESSDDLLALDDALERARPARPASG